MTERISPRQFHEAAGVEDWRVVFGVACAHVRTGSFTAGVTLVDAIGRLADAEGKESCAATWLGRVPGGAETARRHRSFQPSRMVSRLRPTPHHGRS